MTGPQTASDHQGIVATVWWWFVTLLTLVVLDDLTFGPFFWAISRLVGPWWAVAAIYAIYVPVQLFLVERAMREKPGALAGWMLKRLDLERRFPQVEDNERQLRARVVGLASSLAATLLIGGVLPPLILWRQGFSRTDVHRIAVLTSVLYATEFALLHGLLPAAI